MIMKLKWFYLQMQYFVIKIAKTLLQFLSEYDIIGNCIEFVSL